MKILFAFERRISYCGAMGLSIAMLVCQRMQIGSTRPDGSLGIVKLLVWHTTHSSGYAHRNRDTDWFDIKETMFEHPHFPPSLGIDKGGYEPPAGPSNEAGLLFALSCAHAPAKLHWTAWKSLASFTSTIRVRWFFGKQNPLPQRGFTKLAGACFKELPGS